MGLAYARNPARHLLGLTDKSTILLPTTPIIGIPDCTHAPQEIRARVKQMEMVPTENYR